jgi:lysophospholipase L1-like esterase
MTHNKRLASIVPLSVLCWLIAPPLNLKAQPAAPAAPAQSTTTASTQQAEDPAVPAVKRGARAQQFLDQHQKFLDRAKQGDIDIVFMGDSITQGWGGRGKTVWEQRYADRKAVNFGIGGDKTQHVLWRIANGELDGISPKAVVLMIGTNNSKDNSPADIARGVEACVKSIQEKVPQAKIVLFAIFPRGQKPDDELRQKVMQANTTIRQLADGDKVRWVDINDKLVEPDGTISKDMMSDFLHPGEKGYVIWADALDPVLAEIVK